MARNMATMKSPGTSTAQACVPPAREDITEADFEHGAPSHASAYPQGAPPPCVPQPVFQRTCPLNIHCHGLECAAARPRQPALSSITRRTLAVERSALGEKHESVLSMGGSCTQMGNTT